MNAKEIRRGDYISLEATIAKVEEVNEKNALVRVPKESAVAHEITEDLLLIFGFKKEVTKGIDTAHYILHIGVSSFATITKEGKDAPYKLVVNNGDYVYAAPVEFIHEVQRGLEVCNLELCV